jgi:hypothetical protein
LWNARLEKQSRILGEDGNPPHGPNVSSNRIRGGIDTSVVDPDKIISDPDPSNLGSEMNLK